MATNKIKERGLFDEYDVLSKLSKLRDPLEKLKANINFELFRPTLNSIYENPERKSNAGARPFDYVLMFKILLLQRLYNLSDEQAEFQINDRLSFRRFLGLKISDRVPDCNTIWNFREQLKKEDREQQLFDCFYGYLEESGLVVNKGKMVGASFHEVPRQRNSGEENKKIKEGAVPENWKGNPHRLGHKDTDARWTKKNQVNFYGYKNHVKADTKSKLIDSYAVTDASVHDSQTLDEVLDEKDKGQPLYGDSAYSGEKQEATIASKEMISRIHEKGCRNNPLTDEQKASNRDKSKTRARVEHIFGFVQTSMMGSYMRCIGIARAKVAIGLTNLTYNICRSVQLGMNMYGPQYARA